MSALYYRPPSGLSSSSIYIRLLSAIFLRPIHAGGHSRTKLAENFTPKATKHYIKTSIRTGDHGISCAVRASPRPHWEVTARVADGRARTKELEILVCKIHAAGAKTVATRADAPYMRTLDACANVPTPSSQDSDSDTIIAGSSDSEFDLDLSSDEDGPNGAQVASTPRSRADSPYMGVAPLQLIRELVIFSGSI
ncbi:hypothetical protein PoB_005140200 [Plakobranchus ocellatus]|uniref:Uncharacterized protein n=1 Tax=Plakobranchus ocellatus TaxID=259542 RepID=A0AAV4BZY3_9GAST|nr:hypothetical protein PoB_005140200 [Plakobranchus ocellatus]